MRCSQDYARRLARFEWFGFTVEQARALADGGYDLMFVRSEAVGL